MFFSVSMPIQGLIILFIILTGGYWVHEDEDLAVTEGDVIYFWTNVVLKDNSGYNNLGQSWTGEIKD